MRILSIQDAFTKKFVRQASIKGLEYHAAGHCAHIGKLSPGCQKCFVPDRFSTNFHIGSKCNSSCPYCPGTPGTIEAATKELLITKGQMLQKALKANLGDTVPSISFTGGGEPLMYLEIIEDLMNFCQSIEDHLETKPWYYLYTNGILADLDTILKLKDMGFDEIRFHLGASGFSKKVYKNMANATRHIDTITVETPAWPPHTNQLFEMLPLIEDIGVRHLNIGEVWITEHNLKKVSKAVPDAQVYHCFLVHLYDDGLVYDIVEEVLRRGYSFSVLDCNCFVKSIQRSPGKWVMHEAVEGLCIDRTRC